MAINVAKRLSKLYDRKCPSCKGPLGDTRRGWSVCEMCKSKACSVCSKISVLGVRLTPSGKPLCPKHWSSAIRYKTNTLVLSWKSDAEFLEWINAERERMTNELETRFHLPDDIAERMLTHNPETIELSEEEKARLRENLTDEQREFIRKIQSGE